MKSSLCALTFFLTILQIQSDCKYFSGTDGATIDQFIQACGAIPSDAFIDPTDALVFLITGDTVHRENALDGLIRWTYSPVSLQEGLCLQALMIYSILASDMPTGVWTHEDDVAFHSSVLISCAPDNDTDCQVEGIWQCRGVDEAVWMPGITSALRALLVMALFPENDASVYRPHHWRESVDHLLKNFLADQSFLQNSPVKDTLNLAYLLYMQDVIDRYYNHTVPVTMELDVPEELESEEPVDAQSLPHYFWETRKSIFNSSVPFDNILALISPNGYMPNYGDADQDDSTYNALNADVAVYVLLSAANLFPAKADQYRQAAETYWDNLRGFDAPTVWMCLAYFANVTNASSSTSTPPSNHTILDPTLTVQYTVLNRSVYGELLADKIVLGGSANGPTAAGYSLMELFHAYSPDPASTPMQAGSIVRYDALGTTFLFNKFSSATAPYPEDSNMMVMYPYTDRGWGNFPYRVANDLFTPGVWQLEDFPTDMIQPLAFYGDGTKWPVFFERHLNNLSLVCINRDPTRAYYLHVDSIVLLPDFESIADFSKPGSNWTNSVLYNLDGVPCLQITCQPGRETRATRPTSEPFLPNFDIRKQTHLRLRWTVSTDFQTDPTCACQDCINCTTGAHHLEANLPFYVDTGRGEPAKMFTSMPSGRLYPGIFKPSIESVQGGSSATSAWSSAKLTGANHHDTEWTRSVIMLKEGHMAVVDSILPAGEQVGWITGPTWQFQSAAQATLNHNPSFIDLFGFPAAGPMVETIGPRPPGPARLLLRLYDGDDGRSHSIVLQPHGGPMGNATANFQTVITRVPMRDKTRVNFVTVFLPYTGTVDPYPLAASVVFQEYNSGQHLKILVPAEPSRSVLIILDTVQGTVDVVGDVDNFDDTLGVGTVFLCILLIVIAITVIVTLVCLYTKRRGPFSKSGTQIYSSVLHGMNQSGVALNNGYEAVSQTSRSRSSSQTSVEWAL